MNVKRSIPAALAIGVVALAACTRHDGAPSAESHAPGTTQAATPGPCGSYPKGVAGVINTFCDGPAVVNLTIGAKTYTLHGGACSTDAGVFTLNLGVVSTEELAGPKPDLISLSTPEPAGPFDNAALTVTVDGKNYPLTANSGVLNDKTGSFEGLDNADGVKVSGSFTC